MRAGPAQHPGPDFTLGWFHPRLSADELIVIGLSMTSPNKRTFLLATNKSVLHFAGRIRKRAGI
jgi:hypothetical protein